MKSVSARQVFTQEEWNCSNNVKYHNANAQSCTAESLMGEANRLRHEIAGRTKKSQEDADKLLDRRINQLEFWLSEVNQKLDEVNHNIDRQNEMEARIQKAGLDLEDPLSRAKDCLEIRESRQGIDRVYDAPARELIKETEIIHHTLELLYQAQQQAKEQVRRLKKTKYQLCQDIQRKQTAVDVDRRMRDLSCKSPALDVVVGQVALDTDGPSVELWSENVDDLLKNATKEVTSSRDLEASQQQLLQQLETDARRQVEATNRALQARILETREAKRKLEDKLAMVNEHITAVQRTVDELMTATDDLKQPLARAQTRLRGRTARPCPEMTNDPAQRQLVHEVREIQVNADRLRRELANAQVQLKKLEREKLALAEDVSVKTNTLHLCEGQCQSHRQAVVIPHF